MPIPRNILYDEIIRLLTDGGAANRDADLGPARRRLIGQPWIEIDNHVNASAGAVGTQSDQ